MKKMLSYKICYGLSANINMYLLKKSSYRTKFVMVYPLVKSRFVFLV